MTTSPASTVAASVKVRLPSSLRPLCDNQESLALEGITVADVLANLTARHGQVGTKLFDKTGRLGRWTNVFVNGEDIRFLNDLATPLKTGDELSIVPAVAGG